MLDEAAKALKIDLSNLNEHKTRLKEKLKGKTGFLKSCLKILFGHGGLFFIVAVYAIVGAYILILIELPNDEYNFSLKKISGQNIFQAMDYISSYAWYQSSQNLSQTEFVHLMNGNLDIFKQYVVTQYSEYEYDGDVTFWDYRWTLPRAILFTVTTMATIGYGDIIPKTSMGRIFTVYYGMIGVPLLLLFLANIGTFMANSFKYIYSRLCCRLCRVRRKYSELKEKQKLKKRVLWSEEIGFESYMPTNDLHVPIVVNLVLIAITLVLGGAIFSNWESWTVNEAVYFTFITMSTIGFGDYVPGNSFNATSSSLVQAFKMFVTCMFCLFGMAIISMAINLMSEEVVSKMKSLATIIGVSKVDNTAPNKYMIKISEEGTVHTTPADKDGNYRLLVNEDDDIKYKKKKKGF